VPAIRTQYNNNNNNNTYQHRLFPVSTLFRRRGRLFNGTPCNLAPRRNILSRLIYGNTTPIRFDVVDGSAHPGRGRLSTGPPGEKERDTRFSNGLKNERKKMMKKNEKNTRAGGTRNTIAARFTDALMRS